MARQLPSGKVPTAIQPASPQAPSTQLAPPKRPRGLIANLMTVLLQPGWFFKTFPATAQWVIVAILILIVTGVQAVRVPTETEANAGLDSMPMPDMGGVIDGGAFNVMPPGGFGQSSDMGGVPTDTTGGTPVDVRATTTTALRSAGHFVVAWVILAVLYLFARWLRNLGADFGRNLQVAVWASVPLGLMLLSRLIYYEAGGTPGEMGLTPLLSAWDGYAEQSTFAQDLIYHALSLMTLFWFWHIVLVYLGARFALNGRAWAASLITLFWIAISITVPVVTGNASAPSTAEPASSDALLGEFPVDPMQLPDGMNIPPSEFEMTPDLQITPEVTESGG